MATTTGWNTIESDAGLFTELVEQLGVKGVVFEELLSLDPDSLRALAPLYGIIFLFKWTEAAVKSTADGRPLDGEYDPEAEQTLFFAHQKIQNACATQAILSVLLNRKEIKLGSSLTEFEAFVADFDADLRGETLSNSDLIRLVHNSFSRPVPFVDETHAPRSAANSADDIYHYIAYIPIAGKLYELDGLQPFPIRLDDSTTDENFPEKVVEALYRRIGRYPEGEVRFNLMAVAKDPRDLLLAVGDQEGYMREQEKRENWKRENVLRKENFVGLIAEILKGVLGSSVENQESFEKLIVGAKDRSAKRRQSEQRRKLMSQF
ncbi:ubiquitin carboxyl-terminal hydrolase [Lipomyces oligophaga]|uniref:ubiquitin carboxyl-terminal hydrolase n=1 Tax=Lipomyces oligophaga TaxID=45792 RepID=UPI0034CE959D